MSGKPMVMTPALFFEDGSPGCGRPFGVGISVELVVLTLLRHAVDRTNYLLRIPFITSVQAKAVVVTAAFIAR